MYSFKLFLQEARRNPTQNPKISAYDYLVKYKDDSNIYISFRSIDKIGINPRSSFNTPNGIYTYPLKQSWKEYDVTPHIPMSSIFPFAGEYPYIYVVRSKNTKGFVKDISRYTHKQLQKDVEKLASLWNGEYAYFIDIVDKAYKTARENSPFVKFWNLTRLLCTNENISNESGSSHSQSWNNLLRRIGYTGFCDKMGKGWIHPAEPTQAVFLQFNEFDVVDKIENKTYEKVDGIFKAGEYRGDYWGSDHPGELFSGKFFGDFWNGTFLVGTFQGGTFHSGTWKKGKWLRGTWQKGNWENGVWYDGIHEGGTWYDGVWKKGIWKDGVWVKGTWENGNWHNGVWYDGVWKKGNWNTGEIYTTKFGEEFLRSKVDPQRFRQLEKQATSLEQLKSMVK